MAEIRDGENVWTIKKFKSFTGREGVGFNATFLRNGKAVAEVRDMANGGCYDWDWLGKTREERDHEEKLFETFAKRTETEFDFEQMDSAICKLVTAHEQEKQYKRWCKKKVVVQIGTEIGTDSFSTFAVKPPNTHDMVIAHVKKKYKGEKIRILNEEIK